jgi:hypothetical protein
MSKTNHQRSFKASSDAERYAFSPPGGTGRYSSLADVHVGASWGGDNSNGHRGYAAAKRGGKKFVRTRIRFQENSVTRALARSC